MIILSIIVYGSFLLIGVYFFRNRQEIYEDFLYVVDEDYHEEYMYLKKEKQKLNEKIKSVINSKEKEND